MRATLNNMKFEIQTQIMHHLRNSNSSKHFLNNIFQDYDVEALKPQAHSAEDAQRAVGAVGHVPFPASGGLITKNALATSKNEIYEHLNLKLSEIHQIYSSKIEILSNFMMLAQDEIRDVKANKNDYFLR